MIVRKNGNPQDLYSNPNAPFMNGSGAAACRLPMDIRKHSSKPLRMSTAQLTMQWLTEPWATVWSIRSAESHDGVEGMYFIQQCVASSADNGAAATQT